MDQTIINDILENYTRDFDKNWEKEKYKWEVVQEFKLWDSNAVDFYKMFDKVTKNVGNLLNSKQDWPITDIKNLILKDQETIKEAFKILYDQEQDIVECAKRFKEILIEENIKYGFKKRAGNYVRTIATLLAFRYPERYSIFKLNTAQDFSDKVQSGIKFFSDDLRTIIHYNNMVKDLLEYIPRNHVIFDKYRKKLKEYPNLYHQDSDYFMLAQDIIYYTQVYYEISSKENSGSDEAVVFNEVIVNFKDISKSVKLVAVKGDYTSKEIQNTKIGRLGEQFVLNQERLRLKKLGINKVPYWSSVNQGDGLGYDIISYDDKGNEIYIEVKTTVGTINSTFYISTNEYFCSIKHAEKYYLYRVYEFKDNMGKIAIYRGSLKEFCIRPTQFIVSGKKLFEIKD